MRSPILQDLGTVKNGRVLNWSRRGCLVSVWLYEGWEWFWSSLLEILCYGTCPSGRAFSQNLTFWPKDTATINLWIMTEFWQPVSLCIPYSSCAYHVLYIFQVSQCCEWSRVAEYDGGAYGPTDDAYANILVFVPCHQNCRMCADGGGHCLFREPVHVSNQWLNVQNGKW